MLIFKLLWFFYEYVEARKALDEGFKVDKVIKSHPNLEGVMKVGLIMSVLV